MGKVDKTGLAAKIDLGRASAAIKGGGTKGSDQFNLPQQQAITD